MLPGDAGASPGVPHGTHVEAGHAAVQATAEAGATDASHGVPHGGHVGADLAHNGERLPDAATEDAGAGDGLDGGGFSGDADKADAAVGCNRFPGGFEVPSTKILGEAGAQKAVEPWSLEDLGFPCPPGVLLQVMKLSICVPGRPFCQFFCGGNTRRMLPAIPPPGLEPLTSMLKALVLYQVRSL